MPEEGNPGRQGAEYRLDAQLDAIEKYDGNVIFIPGNHDWYNKGIPGVERQEEYLEEASAEEIEDVLDGRGAYEMPADVSEGISGEELLDQRERELEKLRGELQEQREYFANVDEVVGELVDMAEQSGIEEALSEGSVQEAFRNVYETEEDLREHQQMTRQQVTDAVAQLASTALSQAGVMMGVGGAAVTDRSYNEFEQAVRDTFGEYQQEQVDAIYGDD